MATVPTLPTNEIFLRSPYWITINQVDLDYVLCDLRIWTGDLTSEPVNVSAKLRSTGLDDETSFDIAEFGRDYVEVTYDGNDESNAIFLSYELTIYLKGATVEPAPEDRIYLTGLDGYSTYQDGINYQWYKQIMLSDSIISAYPETTIAVPVLQKTLTGYTLQRYAAGYGGALSVFHTVTGISPVENTADLVRLVTSSYNGFYADRITFQFSDQSDKFVTINYMDCTKYGLTKVHFVNRLGCMQEVHFNGRFDVEMNATKDTYKRNVLVNGNYDSNRHQKSILNKNGVVKFTVNTGWKSEDENDTIIEMMMSEQVWVTVESAKLGRGWAPKQNSFWNIPVNIDSDQTIIQNRLNDKLINYTFSFESAHDWINTVR